MYKKIRQLAGNQRNTNDLPLKDKNRINIYTVNKQVERWREYFEEILNTENVDPQRSRFSRAPHKYRSLNKYRSPNKYRSSRKKRDNQRFARNEKRQICW
ncbi:hypothetical protein ILUMI_09117 [Ignelater luminosus]|uniref:Uncharacterized protein n=1 Tax=Ignelater luminosus TaxID=2038154 RepID=A0A8K0GCR6_IGNLU|nr:hypothetical protein ILUMI_09117 [Ignelater luminosus]